MTQRKFETRVIEADIQYTEHSTAFARFCSKNEFKAIDYENTKTIWPCNLSTKKHN